MADLTVSQLFSVSHALGVDLYKAFFSHKLKDKTLPTTFYRNRFQKKQDYIFDELVECGIANKTYWQDLPYYYITDIGIEQYKTQYKKLVNYKSVAKRDLQYLKDRINLYCEYRHYKYENDNSNHIISAYLNYSIHRYSVSHTTEEVINVFKSELRSYHRKGLLIQ